MATTPKTVKKATPSSAVKTPSAEKAVAKKPAAAKAVAPKKATAAAPKKAAASAPKKSAAVAKKPAAKSPVAKGATKSSITPEQRYRMVAEAAYYHAERQGFMGDPVQNWAVAEAEIAALLSKK